MYRSRRFSLKIVAAFLLLQTLVSVANAGRLEIGVGGSWPWRRSYDSNGVGCTDIGASLFDLPGINAATVESVLDASNKCYSCTIYSKDNCGGASYNIGCGSAKALPASIKRPESFKCSDTCSRCNKPQQTIIG